jgi:hypothetical protein
MKLTPCAVLLSTSVFIACSPESEPLYLDILPTSEEGQPLAPPEPSQGVQLQMIASVAPGRESYGCQLFTAPPEGLFVNREEVSFGPGGHHVLLYRTPYTEIPTHDERGEAVDAAAIHDCSAGATALWKVNGVLGGSESFGGKGLLDKLPEGVAVAIEPGAVLLMSTHYLNATPEPIEVDSRINLHSIPKSEVVAEAGVLYFDNPIIRVPAHGEATARMRCPVSKDISIVSLQSHMHSRGVRFAADLLDAGGSPLGELYATETWKEPPVAEFNPPRVVLAGQAIDYRCDYQSTEAHDVIRGLTESDEMCQLIGPYYPRDMRLEACLDENGDPAATWIGGGSATCGQTLACLLTASPIEKDGGADAWGCVLNSCPAAAEPVSALVRCRLTRGRGACSDACAEDAAAAACESCLEEACEEAVDACLFAECD